MKSLWVLALWTVIIPGCGTTQSSDTWIDSRLVPAIREWELECRSTARDTSKCNTDTLESITVVESYDEPDTVGKCTIGWRGFSPVRKVSIRQDAVEGADVAPFTLRALVLHEMLHCRFDFQSHTAHGIMAPYLASEKTLRDKWAELLREAYETVE